jgi:hypothetical protein
MSCATKYLYLLMTLLAFFTTFFLTSMIKTEMVALEPPPTIESYDDIIEKDIIPKWIDEAGEHGLFKQAPNGSIEKKIWDRVTTRGVHRSILSVNKFMSTDPTAAIAEVMEIVEMKAVSLIGTLLTRIAETNLCAFIRKEGIRPDASAYAHADTRATESMRVMPGSVFTEESFRRQVTRAMNRKFEMGTFVHSVFKEFSYYVFSPVGHFAEVEGCIANKVTIPENHVDVVTLSHYRDLICIAMIMILFSFVILLYEPIGKEGCWSQTITIRKDEEISPGTDRCTRFAARMFSRTRVHPYYPCQLIKGPSHALTTISE